MPRSPLRVRRALFRVAVAAAAWSAMVAWTGGFYFRVAGLRVSSRDYRDALAIALLASVGAVVIPWWTGRPQVFRDDRARWGRRAAAARRAVVTRLRVCRVFLARRIALGVDAARSEPWLRTAPALGLAIGAVAIVLLQLSEARPLWLDEETILLNVRDRPWLGLGGELWLGQSAPLAWLALERAALSALGAGEVALRLVPALFAIGTVVTAFWIGRRWLTIAGSAVLVLLCGFAEHVSHYAFETKHYSADTFWALLLPALVAWAVEGDTPEVRARRARVWWLAAAVGQMLANGALLVAPGCALVLVAFAWRRDGARAAMRVAFAGAIWLAAFAAHYHLAMRFTHESEYLRTYWQNRVPPESAGAVERARWIADRLGDLASNPAGSRWAAGLWIAAALGLAFGRHRALAASFATVTPAAFLLAGLRLVPLHERFSLWIAPALYAGLAMAIDAAILAWRRGGRRRWLRAALAAPLLAATIPAADISAQGMRAIHFRFGNKHSLNDREAVRWLVAQLRPGDALMTTRLGWPAVWWYGGISIGNVDWSRVVRHPDRIPLLEVDVMRPGPDCSVYQLESTLKKHRRVLVYAGFPDYAPGFVAQWLHALDRVGTIAAFSRYGNLGVAAVFDLEDAAAADLSLPAVARDLGANPPPLEGCIAVRPARRW